MSANFYTNVSFTFKGTAEQATWLQNNENFARSFARAEYVAPDAIWVYTEESVDLDDLIPALQEYLQEFKPDSYIGFQWCTYADRPTFHGAGGGVLAVTKNHVTGQTTADILESCEKELDAVGLCKLHVTDD